MEIYLAKGCYWKTEHVTKTFSGVVDTDIGILYPDEDKEPVEAVRVTLDSHTPLSNLLGQFFDFAVPSKASRKGTRWSKYRTGVYWNSETSDSDVRKIRDAISQAIQEWSRKQKIDAAELNLEVDSASRFDLADEKYQDYIDKHPHIFC